ncbi:MAG: phasin family protein [Chromatiaceae bacterium]|nr:phasin family protein [Chromatiaceae bacterium]
MNTTETLNTVKDLSIKGMERMNSLNELNMSLFERMAAQQMDALKMLMEHGKRTMTLATDAKSYNAFLKGQIEAAKGLSEQVMAQSKASMTLAGQVKEDYRSWYMSNLAEVSADLRKVVPAI